MMMDTQDIQIENNLSEEEEETKSDVNKGNMVNILDLQYFDVQDAPNEIIVTTVDDGMSYFDIFGPTQPVL